MSHSVQSPLLYSLDILKIFEAVGQGPSISFGSVDLTMIPSPHHLVQSLRGAPARHDPPQTGHVQGGVLGQTDRSDVRIILKRHGPLQLQQGDVEVHLALPGPWVNLLEPRVSHSDIPPGLHLEPAVVVVVNVNHSCIRRGNNVSSCLIFIVLTESDGDVVKDDLVRDQTVSCCDDVPGDVVIFEPRQTDIISPVIDQRPRTAGAGPGGGAVELDEGRPGELSYLCVFPSHDRLLRYIKSFP